MRVSHCRSLLEHRSAFHHFFCAPDHALPQYKRPDVNVQPESMNVLRASGTDLGNDDHHPALPRARAAFMSG